MKETLLDVVVVEHYRKPLRVHKVIGKNMTWEEAERRVVTGVNRFNLDRVFVTAVVAGAFEVGDKFDGRKAR